MSEIEDVRSAFESVDDALGLDDQIIAASDHVGGGEVALDTAVGLDVLGDPFGADTVVNRDAVCTRRFGKADIALACFARKGNHGDTWMAVFQSLGDFCRRVKSVFYKITPLE